MDLVTLIVDLLRNKEETAALNNGGPMAPATPTPELLPPGTNHRQAGEQLEGRRAMIEKALAEMGE